MFWGGGGRLGLGFVILLLGIDCSCIYDCFSFLPLALITRSLPTILYFHPFMLPFFINHIAFRPSMPSFFINHIAFHPSMPSFFINHVAFHPSLPSGLAYTRAGDLISLIGCLFNILLTPIPDGNG